MTHWKKLSNPNYLGSYAFEPGQEMTLTIAGVQQEMVTGADGKNEECIVARFRENVKPMVMNPTNCKAIAKLYKTPYIEEWVGKQIIVRVQQVRAFGDLVDALRIKPEIPAKAPEFKCGECGKVLKPFGNMNARALADYTRQNYGKVLCADCAKKAKEAADKNDQAQVGTAQPDAEKTETKTEE